MIRSIIILALIIMAVRACNYQGHAQNITPTPKLMTREAVRVIDGDTIVIGNTTHRLWGIDAPELGQVCKDGWPAGDKARGFLRLLIQSRTVTCDNRGFDQYGRTLSMCWVDGDNMNSIMVRTGNAWAYTKYAREYVLDEIHARNNKAGVHTHNCVPAWEWRHGK